MSQNIWDKTNENMENTMGTQLGTFIKNMVRNKINVEWLSKTTADPCLFLPL